MVNINVFPWICLTSPFDNRDLNLIYILAAESVCATTSKNVFALIMVTDQKYIRPKDSHVLDHMT